VIKLPIGVDINNLIDDLRFFSWEAADILLFYSKLIKDVDQKNEIIQNNSNKDPVTLADLKVNELIIQRIKTNFVNINWDILSEENFKFNSNACNFNSDWQWVLDPLDGTKDFIQGTGNYAMHLALNHKQKPILGVVLIPERDELWVSYGKKLFCENRNGIRREINLSEKKSLGEMNIVTSKNHRNKTLKELIHKVKFNKVIVMGSIGCKIASILRGESDIYISLSLPGQSCPKDWDFAAPEAILKSAGGHITDLDGNDLKYNCMHPEQPGIIVATNSRHNHGDICLQLKEIMQKFSIYNL